MEERFKYNRSSLDTLLGTIYIVIGICFSIFFSLVVFSSNSLIVYLMPLIVAIHIFAGIFYLNLNKRDYVVLSSEGVFIDKGLVIPAKRACYGDIEVVRIIGNDMRIGLKSGEEFKIKLNVLTINDIEKIDTVLKKQLSLQ